jgi:hypothetical protein
VDALGISQAVGELRDSEGYEHPRSGRGLRGRLEGNHNDG